MADAVGILSVSRERAHEVDRQADANDDIPFCELSWSPDAADLPYRLKIPRNQDISSLKLLPYLFAVDRRKPAK